MKRKALSLTSIITAFTATAFAHENGYHMMDGWHGTMWGGGLFMLALWVLVILGIIYLGQKILDNTERVEKSK